MGIGSGRNVSQPPKMLYGLTVSNDPATDDRQVVPRRENHQHQHQSKPDSEADLLRSLTQRLPAQGLDRIEQKVSTIEQRNGEEVDQPDADRDHRNQVQK